VGGCCGRRAKVVALGLAPKAEDKTDAKKEDSERIKMSLPIKLDHCVIHVTNWERSNDFYTKVLGAELVARPVGYAYRFGDKQLNVHGPGVQPAEVARIPVAPGNSDLCFEWTGPIADAVAHLQRCGIGIERGPMQRFGAKGAGTSVYFRDPDGSLMEFMSYL
jgi:catechol 2,3-dioxygenase-like lactoylglutathione lyase family enzyme